MRTAVCLLPVVPMRKEPSHRSEMVNQLLFGEFGVAGEEKDDFVFVKCGYDGYEGWVQAKQLTAINEKEVAPPYAYTAGFATAVTTDESLLYVPYASPVYVQEGITFSMAGRSFRYLLQPQQTWKAGGFQLSDTTLAAVYRPYLNAPYLWGGKSVWGTDCSGFVQQVFKLFGVKLLRDAYMQAEQGTRVPTFAEARLGDLAFFQNENGRVTHVGIVLNEGRIVHASGSVRIDTLTTEGIVNVQSKTRTHKLHSIKRMLHE